MSLFTDYLEAVRKDGVHEPDEIQPPMKKNVEKEKAVVKHQPMSKEEFAKHGMKQFMQFMHSPEAPAIMEKFQKITKIKDLKKFKEEMSKWLDSYKKWDDTLNPESSIYKRQNLDPEEIKERIQGIKDGYIAMTWDGIKHGHLPGPHAGMPMIGEE